MIVEMRQRNMPIVHPKPKLTRGGRLDIIIEEKPTMVVTADSKIAFPVVLRVFSILETIS